MACQGNVRLRRASTDDAPGIADVHARGWQKSHQELVPSEYLACVTNRFREDFWRDELALEATERKPWVALIDDRVVGFAVTGPSRDDDVGSDVGEVYQVYVDPECWGRGIGRRLVDHALRDLEKRGFDAATFWVLANNEHARRFAEHQGWSPDGGDRPEDCGGTEVQQLRYRHPLAVR